MANSTDAYLDQLPASLRLEHPLKTLISPWLTVQEDETLLRVHAASGATPAQLDEIANDNDAAGAGEHLRRPQRNRAAFLRIK
jgi:hypothetical protein